MCCRTRQHILERTLYSDCNSLCNRALTLEHFCQAFHAPSRQAPRSALKLDKLNRAPVAGSGPAPSATPSKTPLRQLPQHAAKTAPSPEPARGHGGQALNPLANRPGLSGEERGNPMRTGLQPLANTPGAGSEWATKGVQGGRQGGKQHGGRLAGLPSRSDSSGVGRASGGGVGGAMAVEAAKRDRTMAELKKDMGGRGGKGGGAGGAVKGSRKQFSSGSESGTVDLLKRRLYREYFVW